MPTNKSRDSIIYNLVLKMLFDWQYGWDKSTSYQSFFIYPSDICKYCNSVITIPYISLFVEFSLHWELCPVVPTNFKQRDGVCSTLRSGIPFFVSNFTIFVRIFQWPFLFLKNFSCKIDFIRKFTFFFFLSFFRFLIFKIQSLLYTVEYIIDRNYNKLRWINITESYHKLAVT